MRLDSCSVMGRATRGGRGGSCRATTRHPAERPAVVEDRAVAAARAIEPARRPALDRAPRRVGRDSLGLEDGSAMARPPGRVPEPIDVLATPATLGNARSVAPRL